MLTSGKTLFEDGGPFGEAIAKLRSVMPGLLICAVIGLAAQLLAQQLGGSAIGYALVIGIVCHFLAGVEAVQGGLTLAAKPILRLGVALLGARITVGEIASLGVGPIAAVLAGIVLTLLFAQLVARLLKLGGEFGALSGVAVSICGVSAALTAASVLPKRPHSERDTTYVALGVTALSTVAMVLYPAFLALTDFGSVSGGVFLGATIHDVAQVVGAGYMMSEQHGDVATITKLLRVAMLAPVAVVLSLIVARVLAGTGVEGGRAKVGLPWFLVVFVLLVIVNSAGAVPSQVASGMEELSRACLVLAIAAIGIRTSVRELASAGWRPAALLVAETLFLATVIYLFITFAI